MRTRPPRPAVRTLLLALLLLPALSGCRLFDTLVPPDWTFARMMHQPRVDPYMPAPGSPGAPGMRLPPAGTVARDDPAPADPLLTGIRDGAYCTRPPFPLHEQDLRTGRQAFTSFCAACHGAAGDGDTAVGRRFERVHPRNLTDPERSAYPIGRILHVLTTGYGMMPSYAAQLSVQERWDVAAYVKALQLSQHARLADLPPAIRAQAPPEVR